MLFSCTKLDYWQNSRVPLIAEQNSKNTFLPFHCDIMAGSDLCYSSGWKGVSPWLGKLAYFKISKLHNPFQLAPSVTF